MEDMEQTIKSKYKLQILVHLYWNGQMEGKKLRDQTDIPDGTVWRNLRKLQKQNLVIKNEDKNTYRATSKTTKLIEKLEQQGLRTQLYLDTAQRHNQNERKLNKIKKQAAQTLEK